MRLIKFAGLAMSALFIFTFSTPAQNRSAVSGAEVTGTFRDSRSGSEFLVQALGKNKLRIEFNGVYPYQTPSGAMANVGTAAGEAVIAGDTAVFMPDAEIGTCRITIQFTKPGRINVEQNGADSDCGFGHNVSAAGNYRKTSSKKPVFGKNEN